MTEQQDFRQQQLDALQAAEQQQLSALSTMREAAMESAKYWENLGTQALSETAEAQAAGANGPTANAPTPPSPTTVTQAHFTYLESVLKAQFQFTRTLLGGSEGQ